MLVCWLALGPEPSWPTWALLAPCVPPVAVLLVRGALGQLGGDEGGESDRGWPTMLLILVATMGFFFWSRTVDMPLRVYYATVFYFIGFTVLMGVVQKRCGWFMVGPALSMAALGLLLPHLGFTGLLWGGFYLVFGLTAAVGMYLQMRSERA